MRKGSPLLLCVQGNEMFLPGPIRRSRCTAAASYGSNQRRRTQDELNYWMASLHSRVGLSITPERRADPLSPSSIFMENAAGRTVAPHLSINDSEVATASCDALLFNQAVGRARLVSQGWRLPFSYLVKGKRSKTQR